jgi:hypothetical protein
MIRRGLPIRIFALIAAYALVLHTVLASTALSAHLPGHAPFTNAIICTSASAADQPAGQDREDQGEHSACVLHCLFAGYAMDGWAPAVTAIVAVFAPAEIRLSLLRPIETLGRAITKNPQIPRAPPLA